ncbi:MAG: RNB domain-containing ribonuclease, partial [Pseudomonadota bacterium]
VLVVASTRRGVVWTSQHAQRDAAVVDWDGDEAFYTIERRCVVAGDFAVVVKFGGAYGASREADDPAAAKARDARAPLALDLPERRIELSPEGQVTSVRFRDRLEAHRLIEEFMILANVAAGEDRTAVARLDGVRPAVLRAVAASLEDDDLRRLAAAVRLAAFVFEADAADAVA